MSAPFDAVTPRSWVLAPSTTEFAHSIPIMVGAKPINNFDVPLPLGVTMVRVVWDGSTSLSVDRLSGGGRRVEHTIPAGSGRRAALLELSSRQPGETLRFGVPRPPQSDVDAAQCSVVMIHTPPAT